MLSLEEKVNQLNTILKHSKRIVFFGGAGVSTESGIPDFRSKDGLYHQKYHKDPEYMLSHTCLVREPEAFYKFYFDKMIYEGAQPNVCHKKLVELEKRGKLSAIITQNIDGLHQQAGSHHVLELHGNAYRLFCTNCGHDYHLKSIRREKIPTCPSCGGLLRPDVVLYGEALNETIVEETIYEIKQCDTLIIGGTSLVVYPAATFVQYFRGKNLIIINKDQTTMDGQADLIIHDAIGKVFSKIDI